jgi:O-antigen/teichoic acid export membrane protein
MIRTATALIRRHSKVNWALADQAMVSGVNFLTGILLARYLGIAEFGRFTLLWLVILFVNTIQHAMITSPMMSIGPKQTDAETPGYYGAIIIQQLVFSCVVYLLLFAGVRLSGGLFPEWGVESLALPLATANLAFQFQDFLRRYFFTRGRASVAFVNDAFRYIGQIVFLTYLFISFQGAMDTARVLWVIAIIAAVTTVCGAFWVERVEVNAAILRTTTSRHWHFSKWLTASALMQWTTKNLFTLLAGGLLGSSAVGALRAAQNFMGVVHIFFLGLENIVPVRAAQYFHEEGKKALCDFLKRFALFGGGATAVIAGIAAAAPELWLRLVFGQEYQGYGYVLQWFAASYMLGFFNLPLLAGLRAMEHVKVIFWSNVTTSVFALTVAYPLIQLLGLKGALAGGFLTNLIGLVVIWVGFRLSISKTSK